MSSKPTLQQQNAANSLMFWFWFSFHARILLGYLLFFDHLSYATLLDGVITLGFAGVALILYVTAQDSPPKLAWPLTAKLALAFLFWSGLTLFWTRADSHFSAFAYWAEWALELFVMFMLLKTGDVEELGDACLKGFTLGTALLALAVEVMHPQAEVRGGLGDFQHLNPNFIGNFFAMASLFSLHFAVQSKQKIRKLQWGFLSFFLFLVLLQTLAKTMLAGLLVAGFLYMAGKQFSRRRKLLLILFTSLVLVFYFWISWSYFEGYVLNEDNETLTLTSRTVVWIKAWEMIQERPMLGYGILSFRDYGPQVAEFRLVHAHNEWVMLWFQTGLIGVLLAAAIYVTFFVRMRRVVKDHPAWLPGRLGRALLIYMLIRGLTDASLADLVFPIPLLLTLIPWTTTRLARYKSTQTSNVRYLKPNVSPGLSGAHG